MLNDQVLDDQELDDQVQLSSRVQLNDQVQAGTDLGGGTTPRQELYEPRPSSILWARCRLVRAESDKSSTPI
jgi:hypothetical protein